MFICMNHPVNNEYLCKVIYVLGHKSSIFMKCFYELSFEQWINYENILRT